MKNVHLKPTDMPSRFSLNSSGKHHLTNQLHTNSPNFTNQNIYITNNEEIKKGDKGWLLENNGITKNINQYDCTNGLGGIYPTDKKIILTTDPELIKDGIQEIDDDFLEWFIKNPSCDSVKIDLVSVNEFGSEITVGGYGFDKFKYKIILPKEEPKQETSVIEALKDISKHLDKMNAKYETIEDAAEKLYPVNKNGGSMEMLNRFQLDNSLRQQGFFEGVKFQSKRRFTEEDLNELYRKIN
jgi:hypothetical protein